MWPLILMLLAGHYIGDYGLQSSWMADNKGKSWYVAIAHAATYTAAVAVAAMLAGVTLPIDAVFVLFASHFLIDSVKARWGWIGMWTDQVLHLFFLVTVFVRIWYG